MLIDIDKIKAVDRIRKDFGDLQELAEDIKENGLINPPVITPDTFELIAGERRLRAMKLLGYQQIEVRPMSVKDAEHQLNLEISENETRKDFSKKERIDYAKRLRAIEELKAKERQGERNDIKETFPESQNKQTRDIVAEKLNVGSGKQLEKEEFIVANQSSLPPEDFADWDEGKLSTNKAFLKIKLQLEEKDRAITSYKEQSERYSKKINSLENDLDSKDEKLEKYLEEKALLERKVALNKKEAEQYQKLKSEIDFLSKQKDDLSRRISSATELSSLTVQLQNVLEKDLAPIKFKRCMEVLDSSDVAKNNLIDVIGLIESWLFEMKPYIDKNNDGLNVVYADYTEE